MKKLLLFSILFFIAAINTSYSDDYGVSSLYITTYNDEIFTASIDGNEFCKASNEAEADGIAEGKYFLKVTSDNGNWNSKSKVLFSDYVFIPAGYRLFAVIDDRGSFNIYKKANYDSYYVNHKNHPKNELCECNCDACKNCIHKYSDPVIEYKDECSYKSMKDRDFSDLVSTIQKLTFENSQFDVIKQAVDNNVLTTVQVKQLLKLLTFETTKVEAAKYAYKNTCDKKNYFNIYDVFAFESSITEIKNFIDGK